MNITPSKIIEFTDFEQLSTAIIAHCQKLIKNNGRNPLYENPIINHDFPMELKIGFQCIKTGTVWRIRIKKLRDSLEKMGEKGKIIRLYLVTQEGKLNFAASFYSAALSNISSNK